MSLWSPSWPAQICPYGLQVAKCNELAAAQSPRQAWARCCNLRNKQTNKGAESPGEAPAPTLSSPYCCWLCCCWWRWCYWCCGPSLELIALKQGMPTKAAHPTLAKPVWPFSSLVRELLKKSIHAKWLFQSVLKMEIPKKCVHFFQFYFKYKMVARPFFILEGQFIAKRCFGLMCSSPQGDFSRKPCFSTQLQAPV